MFFSISHCFRQKMTGQWKLVPRIITCCSILFVFIRNVMSLDHPKRNAGRFQPFERQMYRRNFYQSRMFAYRKRDVGKLAESKVKNLALLPSSRTNERKPSWRQLPVLVIPDWLVFPANQHACRLYIKSKNAFRSSVPCTYVEGYNAYLELDGVSCRLMRVIEQEIRQVRLENCLVPGRRIRTYIDKNAKCVSTFAKYVPEGTMMIFNDRRTCEERLKLLQQS